MRPRLLLTINNCKFAVDFFARGLHTRTAVARLPLRQLGFLVAVFYTSDTIVIVTSVFKTVVILIEIIFRMKTSNVHYCFVLMTVLDRIIPYGPAYDDVVYFFNGDEGYSRTMYFRQKFLFGCRYYRRFWVRNFHDKVIVTVL